ncbi:MAG: hypothetical protein WCD89_14940 [Anaerocolumna sp.]
MTEKLFHGYNCFSTALGQHFLNTNQLKPIDTILFRWTFDFNKEALFDEVWCVGACVEATDYLLQYDLYKIEKVKITAHKTTMVEASRILSEDVRNVGSHVIMVDFFLMKSIDWDKSRRFGYYPKHLPHFVTVIKETETDVTYQDPLYRFVGNISKDDLAKARCSTECFMDIDYEYYEIEAVGGKADYTMKDKIYYQFRRFVDNGQLDAIENFGNALICVKNRMESTQDFNWVFNIYLALESVIDMRQNFVGLFGQENNGLREHLLTLLLKWVSVRKDFLNMYRNKDIVNIQSTVNKIFYLREQEEKFAKIVLDKVE